jgi:hypothetical protein
MLSHWHGTPPYLRWASAALVPLVAGGPFTTATFTVAVGIALVVLALVTAAVTLDAAFGHTAER